jgi:NAD-dependent deacetylase
MVLKPDIMFIGEQLPIDAWQAAEKASSDCDLMIVAGSSLEISPTNQLPIFALDTGARLVIINRTPTLMHPRTDIILEGDVAEILPAIRNRLTGG